MDFRNEKKKEDYINDIIQNLKPESPYYAAKVASSIVRDLSADWEQTTLMKRVRSEYKKHRGVEINTEFLSHDEISDSLENADFSDLPDNLFEK
ncbi:MAG: hypothetical protein P8J32_05915 [bacterium]|nr:hypothetical protein [bacterium]